MSRLGEYPSLGPLFLFTLVYIFCCKKNPFLFKKVFFLFFLIFFAFFSRKKFLLFFFLVLLENMFYCWH